MAFFSKVVFAVFFTCGMLLAVAGTFFLADPIKQLKNIIEPQRIIAVIALLVSINGIIIHTYHAVYTEFLSDEFVFLHVPNGYENRYTN